MKHSDTLVELAKALSKAQQKFTGAVADTENTFFKAKYADLGSLWASIRSPLTENGLSVVQVMSSAATGDPVLITMLLHSSGEWISGEQPLMLVKRDPQAIGSAITYARRYGLAAIVGQVQVDDDGHQATQPGHDKKTSVDDMGREYREPMVARKISEAQLKRLFAIQKNANVSDDALKAICAEYGFKSRTEITNTKYNEIVNRIENHNQGATQ